MSSVKTIVALPGLGFDSGVWGRIQSVLPSEYTVMALPLPDQSLSDETSIRDAWLRHYDQYLPERCHLLGWSLGGNVAWSLAQQYPARVASVATLSSNPHFLAEPDWPGITESNWLPFFNRDPKYLSIIVKRFLKLQGNLPVQQALREFQMCPPYPGWSQGLTLLGELDAREFLQQTTLPMWLGFGGADALLPRRLIDVIHTLSAKHYIDFFSDAPHACLWTHPTDIAHSLMRFWGSCDA